VVNAEQLVGVKRSFEESSCRTESTAHNSNKVPKLKYDTQIPAYPLTPLPLYLSRREMLVYYNDGTLDVEYSELYTDILQQNVPRSGPRTCQQALIQRLGLNVDKWLTKKRYRKQLDERGQIKATKENMGIFVKPFSPYTLPKEIVFGTHRYPYSKRAWTMTQKCKASHLRHDRR